MACPGAGAGSYAEVVWQTVRGFLTPRWMLLHVLIWAAAVVMVFLGRWQLDVSNRKHFDLQNFGYSLQWWAFSICAVLFWLRILRDALRRDGGRAVSSGGELVVRPDAGSGQAYLVARRDGAPPVVYRGYVMPQSATAPTPSDGDPVHGAYNDYLWQLALADSTGVAAPRGLRAARPGEPAREDAPSPAASPPELPGPEADG